MILAHAIIGAMPVGGNFSWFWFLGSVIPDIDHLFVLYRHKVFSWQKLVDVMRFEEKYGIRFKTKYVHSVLGAVVGTLIVSSFDSGGTSLFFIAYMFHLLLDWPDRDEKQYLYPFSARIFRGFLPIFSKQEIAFTLLLLGLYFYVTV